MYEQVRSQAGLFGGSLGTGHGSKLILKGPGTAKKKKIVNPDGPVMEIGRRAATAFYFQDFLLSLYPF